MSDNQTPPPAFLRIMDKIYDQISKVGLALAGIALVSMTVIFAWLVFGRYVLNNTPTWVEQVSLLLMMVIAFFGAAVGVRQHTHIAVVVFRNIVPSWVRNIFVFCTDAMMMTFGALMFWHGLKLTIFKWNTLIPLIDVSEGLRSMPLTICGALLFLFSGGHLIKLLLGRDERQDSVE